MTILIILGCVLGSCVLCGVIGSIQNAIKSRDISKSGKNSTTSSGQLGNTQKSGEDKAISDSDVEFALNLSNAEKIKRLEIIKNFPTYSKVSEAIKNIGFGGCSSYRSITDRNKPSVDSLTGLLFGCDVDYKKEITGREYKVVLLGQSKDSIDTIRFQTFGIFTDQARKQLHKDAETILTQIGKGKIPPEFSKNFYAGKQMGTGNGVSNGFCSIQALQLPSNGKQSSEYDRISLDLVFDAK